MKTVNYLFLLAFLSLTFVACKKDKPPIPDPVPTPLLAVGNVPSSFSQKVLIEMMSGEWNGYHPDACQKMKDVIATSPNRIIGVTVHEADFYQNNVYSNWFKDYMQVNVFPSGSVQRGDVTDRFKWHQQKTSAINLTAQCGLAISARTPDSIMSAHIIVGFISAINFNTRLTVLVVEDDLSEASPGSQSNYSTSIIVDSNWRHQGVVRAVLTKPEGDIISLNNANSKYVRVNYNNIDLKSYFVKEPKNCRLVAFVHINEPISDPNIKQLLNVQTGSVNGTKKWD